MIDDERIPRRATTQALFTIYYLGFPSHSYVRCGAVFASATGRSMVQGQLLYGSCRYDAGDDKSLCFTCLFPLLISLHGIKEGRNIMAFLPFGRVHQRQLHQSGSGNITRRDYKIPIGALEAPAIRVAVVLGNDAQRELIL